MKNKINSPAAADRKYQHLFFDLDHTLWDFDANARVALTEVYDKFVLKEKISAPFDEFYSTYLQHNAVLWDRFHKGFISAEDLKWKRMWRSLLDFKIGDEGLAKNMAIHFLEILPTKKLLFDHTIEILEYLLKKNYQLHLITNGFEKTQWSKLNNSNLSKYFTRVITSEGSGSVKPSREIFEYAITISGANISESIMIGDNLETDIQGAMDAGMDTVFVNHINAATDIVPTYTVHKLKELENIF
ncbi:MAG: noncanonical pyrimidine nucleotidase, YjjG family [Chitinophagaceae bacterium]|nr:noncanonical pyrimidine nucleotidase, YjjG family [Chitinophagaceae bacterium]